ncbi:hypothetical protein Hamer_G019348 [Homarus americanus]|uniref:Uncharacterized protein n=1 Tax=Homarus americanus TaxID=6706 RepID=A0A8J5JV15_HOMAM|nr:hypothetical protein Hamer_G019348 [Homarus americanus]
MRRLVVIVAVLLVMARLGENRRLEQSAVDVHNHDYMEDSLTVNDNLFSRLLRNGISYMPVKCNECEALRNGRCYEVSGCQTSPISFLKFLQNSHAILV